MGTIFIVGTGLAFFFELLLLQKKQKSISDRMLAIWMFIIGLHLFSAYGFAQNLHLDWPILILFFAPFPLLHGPFLLLYLVSLTRAHQKVRWYDFLHFLPYFLGLLPFIPFMALSDQELLAKVQHFEEGDAAWYYVLLSISVQASGLLYAIVSFIILKQHQKRVKDQFSYEEQVSLKWLHYLILGIGVIYLVVVISVLLAEVFGLISPNAREAMIFSTVTIFVFLFGYYGIRQESIFTDQPLSGKKETSTAVEPQDTERYQKSGLKKEQINEYYQQLLDFMETEKPYFESRLSLSQLADALDLSPNHLSQVINEKANQNFYQLVNSYRIRCFKAKLKDPANAHLTILTLALDCGFNSKSSFNHTFKKMTGQTPSQYQQTLQEV